MKSIKTEDIIELSSKMSQASVAKILGINRSTLLEIRKRRNILIKRHRRIKFNEDYFEKIDSKDKAYFLGLLYADGYNNEKKFKVRIGLQERDKPILDSFVRYLGVNENFKFSFRAKPFSHHQNQYEVALSSNKMSKDLVNLGCMQAKTFKIRFPTREQVPENLISHFIRGYFDGDGCINFNKVYHIIFTGNYGFIKELLLELSPLLTYIPKIKKHKKSCTLTISNKTDVKTIIDFMYNDSDLYIQRKYDKAVDFIKNESFDKRRLRKKKIDLNWVLSSLHTKTVVDICKEINTTKMTLIRHFRNNGMYKEYEEAKKTRINK